MFEHIYSKTQYAMEIEKKNESDEQDEERQRGKRVLQ